MTYVIISDSYSTFFDSGLTAVSAYANDRRQLADYGAARRDLLGMPHAGNRPQQIAQRFFFSIANLFLYHSLTRLIRSIMIRTKTIMQLNFLCKNCTPDLQPHFHFLSP